MGFMVGDAISQPFRLRPEMIRELANRNFGIGFDQLLVVEPPGLPDVDFRYRIFNADGSEVENCGNGARCFARFVYDQRLTGKRDIRVETASGLMELHLTDDRQVVVDMGNPVLDPKLIPFEAAEFSPEYTVQIEGIGEVKLGAVSMGNPHAVLRVDDIDTAPVESWGPLIEPHPVFPRKIQNNIINPPFMHERIKREKS